MFTLMPSPESLCYLKEETSVFSFLSSHKILFFEILVQMVSGPVLMLFIYAKLFMKAMNFSRVFYQNICLINQDVTYFLLWEGEAMILFLENMLRRTLSFPLRNSFLVTNGDN